MIAPPPMDAGADRVDLWVTGPADRPSGLGGCAELLDAKERERASALRAPGARGAFVLGRAFLRWTLSRYRPVAPGSWSFEPGPNGKPRAAGSGGLEFNLTSTAGLSAVAVRLGAPVGVDAEPWPRGGEVAEIAEEFMTPRELAAWREADAAGRPRLALRLWTIKEAVVKANGWGLPGPLRQISVPEASTVAWAPGGAWAVRTWGVGGHCVALAFHSGPPAPRVALLRAAPLMAAFEAISA